MNPRALSVLLLVAACGGLDQPATPYPDPITDFGGFIAIRLIDPLPYSLVETPVVMVTAGVEAVYAVTAVDLQIDDGDWQPMRTTNNDHWLRVALRPGANDLVIRAIDSRGQVAHFATELYYLGSDPTVRITSPVEGGFAGLMVTAVGEATAVAPATVTQVQVRVDDGAWVSADLELDGSFEVTVPNGDAATPELCALVLDSEDRSALVCKLLRADDQLPELTLLAPSDGEVTVSEVLEVNATASDDVGIDRVEVQVNDAGWITANGSEELFWVLVTLRRGANSVQVRAIDLAGNEQRETVEVYAARTVTLRTHSADEGSLLTLTLDKSGLEGLVPADEADDIDMLYLDVRGLMLESLKAMRDYDLYGMDTSSWGPAEWSMQRILAMTPDTADVTGTSLANIMDLSQGLGLSPAVVLADLADIGTTDPFLTLEETADGIFENIIEPHPGMVVDPADGVKKIPVTLGDALDDLVGLADKLGPAPPHPGILFEPSVSPVLLPNFQMTVTARSSLRQHDGIDLAKGKTYLFATEPGADLLEFDFMNPEWFSVEGVADEPEVDLNFLIVEHPSFVPAGTTQNANPEGIFYRGDSPVWGIDSWTVEYLIADLMYEAYHDRYADTAYGRSFSYDLGAMTDAAVINWLKGWVTIETVGGVGEPPPPQYLWDSVLELAQVRLHDGGLAEGGADLHLALSGVRVPLSAEQVVESTRPVLESQKALMAEVMVGDHSTYASDCDLFLVRGEDEALYLYFVHAEDVPGLAVTHTEPGFFADAELTTKLSTTAGLGSGDNVHEKVPVSAAGGEVYFVQDVDGVVWEVTTLPLIDDELRVQVLPAGDWR